MSGPPPTGLTTRARVVNIVDADTLDVEISRVVRIRLLDCWAPERWSDKGTLGHLELDALAKNAVVVVHIPAGGDEAIADSLSFGRALGHVWLEGDAQSLSEKMVEAGYATKEKP